MKKVEITSSGASDSILAPNGRSEYWVLAVTGGVDGSTNLRLEASVDNETWFSVQDENGDVVFSKPGALLVASSLYYRLNVGTYSTQIDVSLKPTSNN